MACLITYTEGRIDYSALSACIAGEIRAKVDSLSTLTGSQFTSTKTLINATAGSLNTNLNNIGNNILSQVVNSTTGINAHLNQTENNVKSAVNTSTVNLVQAIAGKTSEIIGNLGTRLDQIKNESATLQNATLQAVNSSTTNQTATLLQSIKDTGDSIKASVSSVGGGVGEFIDGITSGIEDFINDIIEALNHLLQPLIDFVQDKIDETLFSAGKKLGDFAKQIGAFTTNYAEIVRRVENGEYNNLDRLLSDLKLTNIDLGFFRSLLDAITIVPLLIQVSTGGFKAFSQELSYLVNQEFTPALLSPDEAVRAYIRGNRTYMDFYSEMAKWGYSDDRIIDLLNIAKPLLDAGDITQAQLRGFISEADYDARLEQLGYAEEERNVIKQMRNQIPPIQDLITMAVREAFTPEIAEQFGQYEDYPQRLTGYAQQHGLSEDWSKAYWASHWGLPSPGQGFEMLHRGIINQDTLKQLLRALDIMPYWREKVIALSYSPLRLVDIRRFFESGVINREEMFNEYKSRGYDDKHALWATNWTIQYVSEGNETEKSERRMLSQAVITKAFNSGRMTRAQAVSALVAARYTEADANLILDLYDTNNKIETEDKVIQDNKARIIKLASEGYGNRVISHDEASEMLIEAGYSSEQVNLELDNIDYEFNERVKAHIVDWYKELYTTYEISDSDLSNRLGEYGFEQGEISRLIAEFSIIRETRTKKPSLEQFTRFLKKGIINVDQYTNYLKGLGYADHYIVYYVQDALG